MCIPLELYTNTIVWQQNFKILKSKIMKYVDIGSKDLSTCEI